MLLGNIFHVKFYKSIAIIKLGLMCIRETSNILPCEL